MACLKKLSFVLCSILLLVAAVLFFTIGTESQAEAAEINEAAYEILVDGETVSEVAVKRGETITVTVEYEGNTYIPAVILGSDEYHIAIDGNRFSLLSDSVVGGELYLYLTIDKDNQLVGIPTPLTVYPIFEDDFNLTQTMTPDGYEINGEFSSANVVVDMAGEAVDTTLSNDDDISGILASSGKDSHGNVTVTVRSLTLSGRNNLGNEMPFTVENGVANLSIDAYATNSALNGSGTTSSPYLIYDEADFKLIPNYNSSNTRVSYKQMADFEIDGNINMNSKIFYGRYYGNSKTITRNDAIMYGGFCSTNEGYIMDLNIVYKEGSSVAGILFCGGVCAYNKGTISSVIVKTQNINTPITFTAASGCGGIVGVNMNGGVVTFCTAKYLIMVRPSNSQNDGGIAAGNQGTILNCANFAVTFKYSTLNAQQIGGLVGLNCSGAKVLTTGTTWYSTAFTIDLSSISSVDSDDKRYLEIGTVIGRNGAGGICDVNNAGGINLINPSPASLLYLTYVQTSGKIGRSM